MNNAKLTENTLSEEPEVDVKPMLRSRQQEIAALVEAIDAISQSQHWKLIESKVFQGSLAAAVNQVCIETDDRKVAHLQGKIEVLTKYADFKGFSEAYRMELEKIKKQLSS